MQAVNYFSTRCCNIQLIHPILRLLMRLLHPIDVFTAADSESFELYSKKN